MDKNDFFKIDYIDSLMTIDHNFKIINTYRFNVRFDELDAENSQSDYLGRRYYEVYPQIDQNNSSMYECMKTNKIIYRKNQIFKDYKGRVFNTCNITIPINRGGKIVGAVELSKDITSISDLEVTRKLIEASAEVLSDITHKEEIKFEDILTSNAEMIDNIRRAKVFINSPNPTLIYGETGTGKEMFVQAMVNAKKKGNEFIALNCAAIPETLIESTLFGSVKGAFTGATDKVGLFELASGGVLFLDELNSMPYDVQAKLLRVLQNGKIRPVGSTKVKKVNVKVVAAMNNDPMIAIENKNLREDLFYRLSSSMIRLTPLRDRKEDILLYSNFFLKAYNKQYNKEVEGLSKAMMDIFMNYKWKGNVRELKHIIENMVSISEEKILTIRNLPIYMKDNIHVDEDNRPIEKEVIRAPITFKTLEETMNTVEKQEIIKALSYTDGHMTKAAEMLGIPRQTLNYKMKRLAIQAIMYKKNIEKS